MSKVDIEQAYQSIRSDVYETPLVYAPELSAIAEANVYLKMEHLQNTGSFKLRGVLSKINSIDQQDFKKTFVAASTGNHAAAFAYAASKRGFKGVLFLPKNVTPAKLKALDSYDIEIVRFGDSCMQTEARAAEHAKAIGGILIHPYNDHNIIVGQGTVALEVKKQLPALNTILAPVGGGGLISGICLYFADNNVVDVIGCQPVNAQEMYDSIRAGGIVTPSELDTICDASAGGIENDAISFDICKKYLAGFELIEEEEIKKAVMFIIKYHHTLIEPTAALPVAALLKSKKYRGKNIALVLTGKKINSALLANIVAEYGDYY